MRIEEITVEKLIEVFKVDRLAACLAYDLIQTDKPIPFVKRLEETLPDTNAYIRQCCNQPAGDNLRMNGLNEILQCCGVEAIDSGDQNFIADYLNTGDTYDTTLILSNDTGEITLGSWGDFLEAWQEENPDETEDSSEDQDTVHDLEES